MINLSLSLLKHSDIREEIKKYLQDQYQITYTDGSNFNYIIEFLSILNMMMSYQLTNVAKNLTLAAVNDRSIAVDLSQKLGYNPKLRIPSRMTGNFKIASSVAITSLRIANIILTGSEKGYNYVCDDINITTDLVNYKIGENTYEFPFTAYQVDAVKINTKISESEPYIYIDSEKIAEKTITVNVDGTDWSNFSNFDNIPSSTDTVFFINEDPENNGRLFVRFGNGLIGAEPSISDDIELTYYTTEGADGNGETELTITNMSISCNIGGLTSDDFGITNLTFSYGGKDFESIEDIKINAPRYFNTKNRLVSKADYEAMLNKLEDTEIKYFSIIDMYSRDNLEYFYKLGNIYLSMVPASIYSTEFTTNNMYTKNQTLALEDIDTLNITGTVSESSIESYEDNFILSTNRVFVSPSYLYVDILPKIELVNRNYSIGLIGNDLLPQFKTYSEEIEGLNKEFRSDEIINLIMDDDRIKSTDLSINFSILTNQTNLLGTKQLSVPSSVITTNKKACEIDNLYLNYKYDFINMPDDRKAIYGALKPASTTLFNRYLTMDNYFTSINATLATSFYVNPVIDGDSIDFSDYFYDANSISLSDGSIADIVIKTVSELEDFNGINYINDDGNIPLTFTEGSNPYNTSYYDVQTGDEYFIYFKRGYVYYYLGAINLQSSDNNNNYTVNISYNFSSTGDLSIIKEMFDSFGISMIKNKPLLNVIDSTYNIPYDITKYNNTKISFYILNNANTETTTEYLKIRSYKPIGTLSVDANNKARILNIQSPFTAETVQSSTDITKEYLYISIGGTVVLELLRDKLSGLFDINNSVMRNYPAGTTYETYKNQKFAIIQNVLYCYEIIDDVIIGSVDRYNNKLKFNDFVSVNNSMIKLETFIGDYDIIDDNSVYQLSLRNAFTITNDNINFIQDFDAIGGICNLYNFRRPIIL